jgi:hypothetical protein
MTAPGSDDTPSRPAAPEPAAPAGRVVVDVTIAAPIDAVWRALRDPALIAQWFGWDYDQLAAEIDLFFISGDVELEPGRRLGMGGDAFELEAVGGATRVRLVRADAPASDTWDGVYDDVDEGWRTFVAQLAFWLEAQGGVAPEVSRRRTVYLAGHRESDAAPSLLAALGLAGLDGLAVGQPYALTASTGDTLRGVVRFRTEHQLGVSVDAWGPGLLVVARRPPSPKSPHGGGFALITTFGWSDADTARLGDTWASGWTGAFARTTRLPAPA